MFSLKHVQRGNKYDVIFSFVTHTHTLSHTDTRTRTVSVSHISHLLHSRSSLAELKWKRG